MSASFYPRISERLVRNLREKKRRAGRREASVIIGILAKNLGVLINS